MTPKDQIKAIAQEVAEEMISGVRSDIKAFDLMLRGDPERPGILSDVRELKKSLNDLMPKIEQAIKSQADKDTRLDDVLLWIETQKLKEDTKKTWQIRLFEKLVAPIITGLVTALLLFALLELWLRPLLSR